jgi:hypothetical protein
MASKKIVVIVGILLSCSVLSRAGDFEGRIIMCKQTPYDTTFYEFSVKEKMVRMDIKNSFAQIMQSLIINLESEKIIALSPNHKLYTTLKKEHRTNYSKEDYELIKTPNFKYIDGYKCYLWHVRNKPLNSDISFWVTDKGFSFFPKVIKLLNYTEDFTELSNYFIQTEPDSTFFPVQIIERTLLKEEKSKVLVTKISSETVNSKIFEVPMDYKLLRY